MPRSILCAMMKDDMTILPRFTVLLALLSVLVMPALATASTVTLTDYTAGNSDFFNECSGRRRPVQGNDDGSRAGN